MIATLIEIHDRYPVFFWAFGFFVGWPTLTGILSFGQAAIAKRYPVLWKSLSDSGLDLAGFIRTVSGGKAPDLRSPTPATAARALLDGEGRDALEQARLAKAYASLSRSNGGKNREGLPLPSWDELSPEAREGYAAFGRSIQNDLDAATAGRPA